jgi:predicted ABC-class ATPase
MLCCAVQVMGGSGDYFADADTVIVMDSYTPSDQTAAAHAIAASHAATLAAAGVADAHAPPQQQQQQGAAGVWVTPRVPLRVYDGCADTRGVKTHVRGLHHIQVRAQSFWSCELPLTGCHGVGPVCACVCVCVSA